MPSKNHDLHGNAPDHSAVALLLIDTINDLEFPEGDALLGPALEAAEHIAELKRRAKEARVPVIYVNDNFGRWRSDFRDVVEHCLGDGVRGEPLVRKLEPQEDDYFVLKPKHSAFFSTTLETLLEYLGARRLILTGFASDVCVLFTAMDAHMRDLEINVPEDCVAAASAEETAAALRYMKRALSADIRREGKLDLKKLREP